MLQIKILPTKYNNLNMMRYYSLKLQLYIRIEIFNLKRS